MSIAKVEATILCDIHSIELLSTFLMSSWRVYNTRIFDGKLKMKIIFGS